MREEFDKQEHLNNALKRVGGAGIYINGVPKDVSVADQQKVEAELIKMEAEYNEAEAYTTLNSLYDMMRYKAQEAIAGQKLSQAQVAEYKEKQEAVKSGDVDYFANEAIVNGTTAQAEFDASVRAFAMAEPIYKDATTKMVAVRRVLSKLIEAGNYERFYLLVAKVREFKIDITIEEIKATLES